MIVAHPMVETMSQLDKRLFPAWATWATWGMKTLYTTISWTLARKRSSPGLPRLWHYRNPKIIRLSLSSFFDEVTSGKRHVIILGGKWWKMLSRMQPFVTIRILRLGISEITTCWVVDHVRIPSPQQNLAPENGCLSIDDGWKCSKCVFPSGVHVRKEKVREVRVSGSVLKLIIAWTWGGLIPLRAKASSWVGFAQDDEDNLWRDVGDGHLT